MKNLKFDWGGGDIFMHILPCRLFSTPLSIGFRSSRFFAWNDRIDGQPPSRDGQMSI